MRFIIVFVLVLALQNSVRAETVPEGFILEKQQRTVARPTVARVVSDVLSGHKVVRPSMMPPDIADRLHRLDELDRKYFAILDVGHNHKEIEIMKEAYAVGQIDAILGLLFSTGLTDERIRWTQYININEPSERNIAKHILPSRLRALATVLLLTNYKEPKPLPPSNIVQLAIPER
ncbi:MAG: hypothetical protein NOU37_07065 [Candidatus Brocadiales bacterium]|nr:hypothetical protein [Candidatus Bathyanammoxibius amoris]